MSDDRDLAGRLRRYLQERAAHPVPKRVLELDPVQAATSRRGLSSAARWLVSVGLAVVVAAALSLAIVVGRSHVGPPSPAASSPTTPTVSASATPAVSRQQVLDEVAALKGEVLQLNEEEAKLSTWATLLAADPTAQLYVPPGSTPSSEIWVVAVSGKIAPEFNVSQNGLTAPWAIYVYDADTGLADAVQLGGPSSWPSFFDSIPDLSTTP